VHTKRPWLLPMAMAAICAASQDPKTVSFEVASVAPNRETSPGRERLQVNPGGLSLMKASLWFCIQWAYNVRPDQVSGPTGCAP
jgi:hypothetical protein